MANTKKKNTKSQPAPKKQQPKKTETKPPKENNENKEVSQAAKRQKTAIILMACAVLLICLAFIEGEKFWLTMHGALFGVFGFCAYILPVVLIYMAVIYAKDKPLGSIAGNLAGTGVLVALLSGAIHILANTQEFLRDTSITDQIKDAWLKEASIGNGGFFGAVIGGFSARIFGKVGAAIIIIILIVVVMMFLTGTSLLALFATLKKPVDKVGELANERLEHNAKRREQAAVEKESEQQEEDDKKRKKPFNPPQKPSALPPKFEDQFVTDESTLVPPKETPNPEIPVVKLPDGTEKTVIEDTVDAAIKEKKKRKTKAPSMPNGEPDGAKQADDIPVEILDDSDKNQGEADADDYVFPPLDCLDIPSNDGFFDPTEEIEKGGKKLIETLESFKVKAEIINISRGPSVTRYELLPDAGVRINKITALADDIALRLAAKSIRIAPVSGKTAIGIEVPNSTKSLVSMREMIDTDEFKNAKSKLHVVLGKDIAGNIITTDLEKMPHLLVAGTTGSGKSVCMNSMIISLLYNARPDEVKLLMIDPKMVEFIVYNGIAHLEVPVVADPRKAAGALAWAVSEMEKRYKLFSENGVRNIGGFNKLCETKPELEKMHSIVIFIDELADLMMVAPKDVEEYIARLSQKARAAGIHLVVATQRPTVDVITGTIKNNIPSRIALMVSSNTDSRTIIDQGGAEKLLGNGDLLFMPVGSTKPLRVQGCFVSDGEIANVVEHIKSQVKTEYNDDISREIELKALATETGKKSDDYGNDDDSLDPMFNEAVEVVVNAGQASTTMLQKKLKLGYARASRVIDQLEENGIVGPSEGAKPRTVLITKTEWYERQALADGAKAAARSEQLLLKDIDTFSSSSDLNGDVEEVDDFDDYDDYDDPISDDNEDAVDE